MKCYLKNYILSCYTFSNQIFLREALTQISNPFMVLLSLSLQDDISNIAIPNNKSYVLLIFLYTWVISNQTIVFKPTILHR